MKMFVNRGDGGDSHGPADRPEGPGGDCQAGLHLHTGPPGHRRTGHRVVQREPRHHSERPTGKINGRHPRVVLLQRYHRKINSSPMI